MGYQIIPEELLNELKELTFVYLCDNKIGVEISNIKCLIVKEFNNVSYKLIAMIIYLDAIVKYEIKDMTIDDFTYEHIETKATREFKAHNETWF